MANNRMYLRCRTCGDIFFLGKTYDLGYYTLDDYYENKSLIDSLNDFYDEHNFCIKEINEKYIDYAEPKFKPNDNVYFENQFEICYEFFEDDKND